MKDLVLPISEAFHSIQGEGQWTGTPMHFIRTAGCSVGKPQHGGLPLLKTGKPAWLCHTYDGRAFWCDTDFNKRGELSIDDIIEQTWEEHICFTGGEPLLHAEFLTALSRKAIEKGLHIHLETSGTIPYVNPEIWLTVSPKQGALPEMLLRADEIKLLVDDNFNLMAIPSEVLNHANVYLQPVNEELSINPANLKRCLELLHSYPKWKLSVQLHKCFGWR